MRGSDENYRALLARLPLEIALISLCILTLAGCSMTPARAETRVLACQIPSSLEPRDVPAWNGQTYADLIEHALRLHEAAKASELDKQAARNALGGK